MALPDIYKHFFQRQKTEPIIPRWFRLTVGIGGLFVAQFLAYRNEALNLARVINEKQQLSIRLNELNASLQEEKQENAKLPKPFKELSDSLRRRTFKLADEYTAFFVQVQQDKPPDAVPNSAEPSPSEERKKAMQIYKDYWQKVADQYASRFKERFVGITKEYESRGVRVGFLANDFAQRMPMIPQLGSAWEGMDEISRFRELAYHVDARDHLIVLGF